jgi:transposase
MTQIRTPGSRGHTYYNAKLAEGKTPREARRCLERRLANHIWRTMITDARRQAASLGGHLGGNSAIQRGWPNPNHQLLDKSLPRPANHDSTTALPAA